MDSHSIICSRTAHIPLVLLGIVLVATCGNCDSTGPEANQPPVAVLGPDMTVEGLLADGYKAVYLALGAHKGIEMGIPGEKAPGVRQGVDFLKEVNLTGKAEVGRNVIVIGGGNVAIDVSRAAVRLGASSVPSSIGVAGMKCLPGRRRCRRQRPKASRSLS